MSDPRLKQIKIKFAVLKRISKEKITYEKEAETEKLRYQKMKMENRDDYDLKKQEEVINETIMMIPDCEKRTFVAFNDLKSLLEESVYDLSQTEEYINAKAYIDEIQAYLNAGI